MLGLKVNMVFGGFEKVVFWCWEAEAPKCVEIVRERERE
jgi:hypothetical protein